MVLGELRRLGTANYGRSAWPPDDLRV